jgi:hypothetical protein
MARGLTTVGVEWWYTDRLFRSEPSGRNSPRSRRSLALCLLPLPLLNNLHSAPYPSPILFLSFPLSTLCLAASVLITVAQRHRPR